MKDRIEVIYSESRKLQMREPVSSELSLRNDPIMLMVVIINIIHVIIS